MKLRPSKYEKFEQVRWSIGAVRTIWAHLVCSHWPHCICAKHEKVHEWVRVKVYFGSRVTASWSPMFIGPSVTCIEIGDSDDDGVSDVMPISKSPSSAGWAVGLAIFVIPLASATKARRAIWTTPLSSILCSKREKGEGERGERSSVANGMAQLPQSSASLKHLPVWTQKEAKNRKAKCLSVEKAQSEKSLSFFCMLAQVQRGFSS